MAGCRLVCKVSMLKGDTDSLHVSGHNFQVESSFICLRRKSTKILVFYWACHGCFSSSRLQTVSMAAKKGSPCHRPGPKVRSGISGISGMQIWYIMVFLMINTSPLQLGSSQRALLKLISFHPWQDKIVCIFFNLTFVYLCIHLRPLCAMYANR